MIGSWLESGGGGTSHREVVKMKKVNQQLIEENNLLKLKLDILLDMVSKQPAQTESGYPARPGLVNNVLKLDILLDMVSISSGGRYREPAQTQLGYPPRHGQ